MTEIYLPAEDSYALSRILEKKIPLLLEKNPHLQFLEVGAGSGMLLETAKSLGVKREHIFALDINPNAVEQCKSLGFNCIYSDLFEAFKERLNSKRKFTPLQFDVIVFNPPYLPEDLAEPKESRIATTGGEYGSEIINRFLRQSKDYLNAGGKIFLLTSSLTKKIDWAGYFKKIVGREKIFMEELFVWELQK